MTMKLFTGIVVVILLSACGSRSSDESQVRAVIDAAEAAAEDRDASDVIDLVSFDYSDSNGYDRAQLQNFLRAYFLARPKLELLVRIESLEFPVAGLGRARIAVTALPSGESATLAVEFRQEKGEWRVARADRVRQ
jgi:hypothetical protein